MISGYPMKCFCCDADLLNEHAQKGISHIVFAPCGIVVVCDDCYRLLSANSFNWRVFACVKDMK